METWDDTSTQGDAARHFGDKPLRVVSERWEGRSESARIDEQLQVELASFARGGKRIALDGGHVLPVTRPTQIADAIREVTEETRGADAFGGLNRNPPP